MRTALLVLVAGISFAKTTPQAVKDAPPAHGTTAAHAPKAPVALEEYFKIRRIGSRSGILLSFSHDEKLVAYLSDESGRTEIWVQPMEGGAARQLTHVKGFIQAAVFSPTADVLAFTSDTGGDELPHLYLTDSKGSAPRDLVPNQPAQARTDFVEWADDGKTFLYLSSQRDPKYMDLYEYNLATGKSERLWEGSGKLSFNGADRDHKRFAVTETLSDSNNDVYILARGQKKPVLITPHKGDVLAGVADFSRDGKTVYLTSDEGNEFQALYAMDAAKHTTKPVLKPSWDVEGAGFSHTFKYFFTLVNADGQMQLVVKEGDKPVTLPAPPPGGAWVPLTWSVSDRYLGVRLQGDGAPSAPYIVDLKTNQARRLLDPLPPTLQGRKMIVGELVHIPTFDTQKVPAFVYKPEGAGPFPAVIDVHGGPTAQSRREFAGIRQYLLSKGYVVLVPNVRGSTGYGKGYTRLDNRDLGGGPLKDVVACKKWLVDNAKVDAKRVVVMGGSYGGYMALAAATFTPAEFAVNVDFFGVSDLKTLVESFPPYWQAEAEFIYKKFGNPKDPADATYQHDRSPIHFVDKIVHPLLVVQGDRDARVRKDQSDGIVEKLKQRKIPVHYLILKDEGHGFSRTESIIAAYRITDRFLDRYLFDDASVKVDQ